MLVKVIVFFRKGAETLNLKFNSNFLINRHPLNSMFKDFDFTHFFEIDKGAFCNGCNKIRGVAEKSIEDFRISGQGDGTNRNNDDACFDSCDDAPTKGVSIECSLNVHSSEMFDF